MMRITPLSLPSLVAVLLLVDSYTSGANGVELTCTSPCQDASGHGGIGLPPCYLSTVGSCQTDVHTVPVNEAPSGPLHVGMESSSFIAADSNVYLDMAPYWQASPDRINLLTGYEVKVKCHSNICATESFCVTMLFNRTLTLNDTNTNFSMSCQYGNFSRPGKEYITIIRSLPNNNDNTNEGRFQETLPNCQEAKDLTVCKDQQPENWLPTDNLRPAIEQLANGSVRVIVWPNNNFHKYEISLEEQTGLAFYDMTIDTMTDLPSPLFNDVQEGTYRAYVRIDRSICGTCRWIRSRNTITVTAVPTSSAQPIPSSHESTTSSAQSTPSLAQSTGTPSSHQYTPSSHQYTPYQPAASSSKLGSSVLLAAISGALGGVLFILILIFLACSIKWNLLPFCKHGGEEVNVGEDATKSAMPLDYNSQYGDCDSLSGKSYTNQWPLMNGSNPYSPTSSFTSPSMVAPIIHNDNLINGRLQHESEFYANSMAYQQGDSVSKVAVDIHSSPDPQTWSKDPKPETPDSGLEMIFPDDVTDDGRTLFSLALTSVGDEV